MSSSSRFEKKKSKMEDNVTKGIKKILRLDKKLKKKKKIDYTTIKYMRNLLSLKKKMKQAKKE